jgi:hypothetical protein
VRGCLGGHGRRASDEWARKQRAKAMKAVLEGGALLAVEFDMGAAMTREGEGQGGSSEERLAGSATRRARERGRRVADAPPGGSKRTRVCMLALSQPRKPRRAHLAGGPQAVVGHQLRLELRRRPQADGVAEGGVEVFEEVPAGDAVPCSTFDGAMLGGRCAGSGGSSGEGKLSGAAAAETLKPGKQRTEAVATCNEGRAPGWATAGRAPASSRLAAAPAQGWGQLHAGFQGAPQVGEPTRRLPALQAAGSKPRQASKQPVASPQEPHKSSQQHGALAGLQDAAQPAASAAGGGGAEQRRRKPGACLKRMVGESSRTETGACGAPAAAGRAAAAGSGTAERCSCPGTACHTALQPAPSSSGLGSMLGMCLAEQRRRTNGSRQQPAGHAWQQAGGRLPLAALTCAPGQQHGGPLPRPLQLLAAAAAGSTAALAGRRGGGCGGPLLGGRLLDGGQTPQHLKVHSASQQLPAGSTEAKQGGQGGRTLSWRRSASAALRRCVEDAAARALLCSSQAHKARWRAQGWARAAAVCAGRCEGQYKAVPHRSSAGTSRAPSDRNTLAAATRSSPAASGGGGGQQWWWWWGRGEEWADQCSCSLCV